MINRDIFRQYDIRGIVDKDLTPDVVNQLGKGFGTFLKNKGLKTVVIGGDARLSSPLYIQKFSEGLVSVGLDVTKVGILATPTLYWAIQFLGTDAGVMITGSHNPPEYNGFKMNIGCMGSIFGDDILAIYDIIKKKDFASGKGSVVENKTIVRGYQKDLISRFSLTRPIKVVLDAGNGAGGPIAPAILKGIGADVKELYCRQDGSFPNHHPDPTVVEYMQDLIKSVKNTEYELGIGLDGDADRIGIIDEKGQMIFGDQILNIFARDFLEQYPGHKVIADVKTSQNFYDDIKNKGGLPVMYKTGHSMIKQKMIADNILFGGEMSGHIFFKDRYFGYDDAIYATCRFLEILSKTNKKVSELLIDQPKLYNTPEIRVDCSDKQKFELVERVTKSFEKQGYDIVKVDGVRINLEGGWGLVRASNTQPVLVMRFEAKTKEILEKIRQLIEKRVNQIKKTL